MLLSAPHFPATLFPSSSSSSSSCLPCRFPTFNSSPKRPRHAFSCQIAVEVDGSAPAPSQNGLQPSVGSRIRVLGPLTVFHVPKHPQFELGGCEGEIKDVLKSWKGKPISANLPYKVQFILDLGEKPVKFVAHLKDNEFEVIG